MQTELVVTRYCEDLAWLAEVNADWRVTIYDKSLGGPRERIALPGYSSPDGPDSAPLWPGAIPMENVGLGDRSMLYHIARHYDSLAPLTVFVQGDPYFHVADWQAQVHAHQTESYIPFGAQWECDAEGRPHFDTPLVELREMFRLLAPGVPMPDRLQWHGYSMFAARRERLWSIPRARWAAAEQACVTKRHSCALERLYDTLLGDGASW